MEFINDINKKLVEGEVSFSEKFMSSFIKKLNSGEIKKDICTQNGKVFKATDEEIRCELESYQRLLESGIIKQEFKEEQEPILKKTRR